MKAKKAAQNKATMDKELKAADESKRYAAYLKFNALKNDSVDVDKKLAYQVQKYNYPTYKPETQTNTPDYKIQNYKVPPKKYIAPIT